MPDASTWPLQDGDNLVVYAYYYAEGHAPFLFLAREWEHGDHRGITPELGYVPFYDGDHADELWNQYLDDLRVAESVARLILEGSVKRIGPMPPDLVPHAVSAST